MPSSRKTTSLLAVAALTALAACNTDKAPTGPRSSGPSGRLRVVNATPDATVGGPANVRIGDQAIAVNVAYGAATSYVRVYTGPRDLHVTKTAGDTIKVVDQTLSVDADKDFTAFVLGTKTGTGISAVVAPDDNAAPDAGKVKLRFVQASPTGGSVDVYVTAPAADITIATPTLSSLDYASLSSYLMLTAGTYRVRVTAAGTKTVLLDVTQTARTSPPVPALPALAAGQIRTIVILDKANGGTPLTASVLQDRNP